MKTVAISLLGVSLDSAGKGNTRWERWRPTVSLCQQDDLVIDRLELLHQPGAVGLAKTVARDIESVSPETTIVLRELAVSDPWDLGEVYSALHQFARTYP
ncbi:MAG: transcriptional regulator, partial [Acidobacteria bacterium]|nr:transcriptional regulator [Acidobacteriota bacterium]